MPSPHPRVFWLVGSYVYSYDVASNQRPEMTSSRPIPGMRPSYDADHPNSATPIYDALYSEYRRLFRALPGDRSGEENLRFTGFAVRQPYPGQPSVYPPQQQSFQTYAGHAQGTPQFTPGQQSSGGNFFSRQPSTGQPSTGQPGTGQFSTTGHGWVASGYLGPAQSDGSGPAGRHRSMLSLPPGQS